MKRTEMGLRHDRGKPEPGELKVIVALRGRTEGKGSSRDKLKGKLQVQRWPG
jgi:hypothetical protein